MQLEDVRGQLIGVDQHSISQNVVEAARFGIDEPPGEAHVLGDDRPRTQKLHQLIERGGEWGQIVEQVRRQPDALGNIARHALARVDGRAEPFNGGFAADMERGNVDDAATRGTRPGGGQGKRGKGEIVRIVLVL